MTMAMLMRRLLIVIEVLVATSSGPMTVSLASSSQETRSSTRARRRVDDNSNKNIKNNNKALQICSVAGGLNIVRLVSANKRTLFLESLEDVELIREYMSEAAYNGGIAGGLHDSLEALDQTLDWQARNLTNNSMSSSSGMNASSTLAAGLGYSDDRATRRIERYVGLANEPLVGTKQSDLAFVDSASNIFPWIVDRRSAEDKWVLSHQNGRSNHQDKRLFDRLYVAAWIGTRGEAWMYYPPFSKTVGHPFSFGDVLGEAYQSQDEEFVKPNLPLNNPERKAFFTPPYADTAVPGLSLITALAPVYYTGEFQGHVYNNTYIASTGVDISVASLSTLLDELHDTLTFGSFAFLVSVEDFHTIVISQSTVEKVYPRQTGMEEGRVTRDVADRSIILTDRRNQTYQVSDTIFQSVTDLDNANWTNLAVLVQALAPGEHSSTIMNITLTGEALPTEFHAMYERWPSVADWALLVFAPTRQVDNAISVYLQNDEISLELMDGATVEVETTILNNGTMDVIVGIKKLPVWFTLLTRLNEDEDDDKYKLPVGGNLTLRYKVVSHDLPSNASSLIAFTIIDDGYPDCSYDQVLSCEVSIKTTYPEELNQLDTIRPYGFTLVVIVAVSAIGCSIWVLANNQHRVVRASQPFFLHMINAGISVMGMSIVPMAIDDSLATAQGCSLACMATPWLLSIGFSITFSALFSKIYRLNQIRYHMQNHRRVDIKTHHVMIPFFIIFTVNVTILSLWTGLDPMEWVRDTSKTNNEFSSTGYCSMEGSALSATFLILLLAVNFVSLVLALVQLYRARGLADEYSEGKYIAIAIASQVQAFLTGVPILIIVTDNPQVSFFVKSSLVFVVSMSTLLLMFVPKVCIAAKETGRGKLSSSEGLPPSKLKSIPEQAPPRSCDTGGGGGDGSPQQIQSRRCVSGKKESNGTMELQKMGGGSPVQSDASSEAAYPAQSATLTCFPPRETVSDISESCAASEFEHLSSFRVSPLEREKNSDRNPQLPTRCVSIAEEEEGESPSSLVASSPSDQKLEIPARCVSIVEETTEDISASNHLTVASNANIPARHCSTVEDANSEVVDCEIDKNRIEISTIDETERRLSG
jgi:7 transmembrane sweet-taste receptor of 3 GCPR